MLNLKNEEFLCILSYLGAFWTLAMQLTAKFCIIWILFSELVPEIPSKSADLSGFCQKTKIFGYFVIWDAFGPPLCS